MTKLVGALCILGSISHNASAILFLSHMIYVHVFIQFYTAQKHLPPPAAKAEAGSRDERQRTWANIRLNEHVHDSQTVANGKQNRESLATNARKMTVQYKSDATTLKCTQQNMFWHGCDGSKSGNELRPGSRHGFYRLWQVFGTISACNRLYKMRCPFNCTTAGLPSRLNYLHNSYGGNLAKVCIED